MNIIMKKRVISVILALLMMIAILPKENSYAATTSMVYSYTTMLESDGAIYYIKTAVDTGAADIYKLVVSTGKKTMIASSDNYISNMIYYAGTIYYTTVEDNSFVIYSVDIDGANLSKICNGSVIYADANGIFYSVTTLSESYLYKKSDDGSSDKLIQKANTTFNYVKNIGSTLYFSQYIDSNSKIKLYSINSNASKLTLLDTQTVNKDTYGGYIVIVSDIIKMNGDIYYQYGTEQGTGHFWYGVLVKIDSDTDKKTIITKNMNIYTLEHSQNYIYYYDMEDYSIKYKYNTKSDKISKFSCKTSDSESYNILGDKTYCAKPVSKKYITVSQFTSGTDKKNLIKNFMKISYKQNSTLNYTANVKKLGNYFLVSVETVDYNDATYGWRGHYIGIKWYVADADGKVITSFS
ncbi:MAG: DUF5050 domain-containing protein [Herbinix sp.]|nr:DUF5050 domain-containing protein [Herbinix sp.]